MKRKMMTDRMVVTLAFLLAAVPIALACFKYTPGPGADNTEDRPCSGGACGIYTSCPGGDSCTSGHVFGSYNCPCWFIMVPCSRFSRGRPNGLGCCIGGTYLDNMGGNTMVRTCSPSVPCMFGIIPVTY